MTQEPRPTPDMTPERMEQISEKHREIDSWSATPELMPCPFCGGDGSISEDDSGRARCVSCDACRCDGPMAGRGMADTVDVIRDRVVSKWSQRVPTARTLTPEQVEWARSILNMGTEQSWSLRCRAAFKLLREVVGE